MAVRADCAVIEYQRQGFIQTMFCHTGEGLCMVILYKDQRDGILVGKVCGFGGCV